MVAQADRIGIDVPYKDPNRKKEWERLNHERRLARRSELRRIHVVEGDSLVRQASQSLASFPLPWLVLGAGSGLALYSPSMGVAAGALILAIAAYNTKGWQWKLIGVVILLISLFLLWNDSGVEQTARPSNQGYPDELES
jgi:hypothetical protein